MTDAELVALSNYVNADHVLRAAELHVHGRYIQDPDWTAVNALQRELERRAVLRYPAPQ